MNNIFPGGDYPVVEFAK